MSKRTLLAILTVVCIFSQSEAAQPPAATKFRIFDSQKQAGEFFRKLPEAQQFAGENGKVNLIPFADARYKRAEKIVAATFQSYKKHYPALVSGIENPPYVLLLESDEVNAFVISDKNPADPIPYLFVVHTEGEKKWKDEGEFAGIIAHELAHLFLRHVAPGQREKIKKVYRADGSEPLGYLQRSDAALNTQWDVYRLAYQFAYSDDLPESRGLSRAQYTDDLRGTIHSMGDSSKPICEKMDEAYSAWSDAESGFDMELIASGSEEDVEEMGIVDPAKVAEASANYIKAAKVCLGNIRLPFRKVLKQSSIGGLQESEKAIFESSPMFREYEKTFDAAPSSIEGLLAATLKIQTAKTLKDFRVYTEEEQADDFGVLVLRDIGYKPASFARAMVNMTENPEACQAILDRGEVPAYGSHVDSHHDTCWRAHHILSYSKYLDEKAASGR